MAITVASRATSGPSQRTPGTNDNVSQREDLANFISMITRDETPFMSSIGKTKATAIYHEWQTDELTPPGNSRISEGTDWAAPAAYTSTTDLSGTSGTAPDRQGAAYATAGAARSRLGNYTQINGKSIAVSGTRRAVDQAGVADEYAYQLKKRGTEMRRDIESDLIHTGSVSGAFAAQTGNVRTFGGYQSWINGATTRLAGTGATAVAAASQGLGTTVPTLAANPASGSTRGALSLSDIDGVMQSIYEEGGKATKIMLSPKLRRDFSDLMVTDSGVRRNIDMDGKLRQSVDVYMSDFGDLMVVPNYIMGLNTPGQTTGAGNWVNAMAMVYDPMWFSIATLRPLQEVDVGQRGDSTVGMFVEECTLEVKNPNGAGAIFNLA